MLPVVPLFGVYCSVYAAVRNSATHLDYGLGETAFGGLACAFDEQRDLVLVHKAANCCGELRGQVAAFRPRTTHSGPGSNAL